MELRWARYGLVPSLKKVSRLIVTVSEVSLKVRDERFQRCMDEYTVTRRADFDTGYTIKGFLFISDQKVVEIIGLTLYQHSGEKWLSRDRCVELVQVRVCEQLCYLSSEIS